MTSFSTPGVHAIAADFSGSVDGTFAASAAEPLSISAAEASRSKGGEVSSASVSTSTPSQAPVTISPPTAAGPAPSPVFALAVLTREAKPLINRRVLAVRARCGTVACAMRATITVKLAGVRHALSVGSADATVPAGEAGNALIAVPPALRSTVRRYLLHHPHTAITLQVIVTASAAGQVPQSADMTLAVWTYAGYR